MNQLSAKQDGNNVATFRPGYTGQYTCRVMQSGQGSGQYSNTTSNQSYLYTASRSGRCKFTPVSSFFSGWQLALVGWWGEGVVRVVRWARQILPGTGLHAPALTPSLVPLDGGHPALVQLCSSVPVEVAAFGCRLNVQHFLQEEFIMPLGAV